MYYLNIRESVFTLSAEILVILAIVSKGSPSLTIAFIVSTSFLRVRCGVCVPEDVGSGCGAL